MNIYSDNNLVIKICEKLSYYNKFNVFNYLKNENKIEIEGYFDNFLITNKILFSVLSSFNIAQDKIVIETMKKIKILILIRNWKCLIGYLIFMKLK